MDDFNFTAQDAHNLLVKEPVILNEDEKIKYLSIIESIKWISKRGDTPYFRYNMGPFGRLRETDNICYAKIILLLRKNGFNSKIKQIETETESGYDDIFSVKW